MIVKCEEFVEEGRHSVTLFSSFLLGMMDLRCFGPELTGSEAERHEAHLTDRNRKQRCCSGLCPLGRPAGRRN